jgi:hypothetical protein
VKAYSEILAEMPILEFGEKSYLASPSSSDYCDSPSVGNISVEDAIDYKKVNYLNEPSAESISIGMSQLDLSRKAPSKRLVQGSNPLQPAPLSAHESRAVLRSGGNETLRLDSNSSADPKSEKKRSKFPSSALLRLETAKIVPRVIAGADCIRDPTEFVESIRDCISCDLIHMVVDRVRAALEEEKMQLNRRVRQLELAMESDCEVIVTHRSSNISTPSNASPRCSSIEESHAASVSSSSARGSKWSCGECGAGAPNQEANITQQHAVDRIKFPSAASPIASKGMLCVHCAGKQLKSDGVLHTDRGMEGSSNSSSSSRDSVNAVKGRVVRSAFEYELSLIRISSLSPSALRSSLEPLRSSLEPLRSSSEPFRTSSGHMDSDRGVREKDEKRVEGGRDRDGVRDEESEDQRESERGRDGGRGGVQRSSRFRNRLQAARDEHHFLADNYSTR